MQKGTISVQTENIFPIIKKYLYSDQEIFLRELVSNAVDATQKLKTLSTRGEMTDELGNLTIEVKLDKDAKTLTISDKGIGMTHDEVEKYITQIAFSGAKEFLEQYEDANAVIGHFGLGFFSAFMVADKVEIHTKSWKDEPAVHWTCDGNTEYTIGKSDKEGRGTDIVLHITEEAKDYAEDSKIEELLNKYCRFLPIEIKYGTKEETLPAEEGKEEDEELKTITVDNIVNDTQPLWKKKPTDLKDEDYIAFYKKLYPMSDEPLFWIHLNVDYPFNLTGVLFFPKIQKELEVKKDRIHLYCNQVFVTDHVESIVPEFLMLLHGVIDSPDIPLNVSRSYLQSDPEVKKINKYITKKVASKLDEMFRKERDNFEQKWEHIGVLIKYGILTDEKFADKADKFCLYESLNGQLATFEEYVEKVKETQTDKNDKVVFLYATEIKDQHSFIEAAEGKGYDVLKFDTLIDPHFLSHVERKHSNISFKRVDSETPDNLVEKDTTIESALTEDQEKTVKELFEKTINNQSAMVNLKSLSPDDKPILITRPEFMRRMKDMSALGGGNPMMGMGGMPDMFNVVVNSNHPIVSKILGESAEETKTALTKQLYDLALLQQNMLKGADLTAFINRSITLI